jgi:hypothetical protein
MNKLLKIKHWQLFCLLFGGFPLVFLAVSFSTSFLQEIVYGFVPCMILYIATIFGWFYAMGTNLTKKLPETVNMKLRRFKIFFSIPITYIILIVLFIPGVILFKLLGVSIPLDADIAYPIFIVLIVSLHLFSIFCIFYCLYFISKSLKAVELQGPVTFNDYAGEFFLIWFFPIGVWFIQPRINKLFDEKLQTTGQD